MKRKGLVVARKTTIASWMVIAILLQLLITQWTVKAAGSREIVDYISFAGTVIGIILAFLAIVYSYLTTASQKNDSESLKSQILRLSETIQSAGASGQKFEAGVGRLEDIVSVLDSLERHSRDSSARVEAGLAEIRSEFAAKRETSESKTGGSTSPSIDERNSIIPTLKILAEEASPFQLICYFHACTASSNSDARIESENTLVDRILESKTIDEYIKGQMAGAYWMLRDMGVGNADIRREFIGLLKSQIDFAINFVKNGRDSTVWNKEQLESELSRIANFSE